MAGQQAGAGAPAGTEQDGESGQGDSAEAFFVPAGDTLVPAGFATSPWGHVLHGRLIGGLTARAVEQARGTDPDLACSRLTIDMFRSARMEPVRVSVQTIRAGRRIAVLDVTVEQADGPVGQGRAVLLRRSEQPDGTLPQTQPWPVRTPPELGPARAPSGAERWTAPWESWPADGPAGGMWIREKHPLVTGEKLTPLVRLAMAADLSSPAANSSDRGLDFINADYTIYLGREPRGEYTGIQPSGHVSEVGIAAGLCVVHDLDGPVGFVANAAIVNSRMPQPATAQAR